MNEQVLPIPGRPADTMASIAAHFPQDVERRTRGSLRILPEEPVYENIEADERVVMIISRHWTYLTPFLGIASLLALVPVILWMLLFWLDWASSWPYALVATWFWYGFVFYYVVAHLIAWRSDAYIVTNERIIDFDAPRFDKKVSETDLVSIHEVRYEAGGGLFLGKLDRGDLMYSDVSGKSVTLANVPMPSTLALALGELIEMRTREAYQTGAAPQVAV